MFWEQIWQEGILLIDLILSVLMGFCIGLERKHRLKEAGVATHTVVCLGSALITVISKYGFNGSDPARLAAQIVTGVGFLGAGMIVYRQHEVRGLTTAAGIWATAGIGMACGAGMYVIAVGATAIIIAVQCLFNMNFRLFKNKKYYSIKIVFTQTERENKIIKEIFGTDRFNHLVITRSVDGKVTYSATLNTDVEYSSTKLNQIMQQNSFISLIERCENE